MAGVAGTIECRVSPANDSPVPHQFMLHSRAANCLSVVTARQSEQYAGIKKFDLDCSSRNLCCFAPLGFHSFSWFLRLDPLYPAVHVSHDMAATRPDNYPLNAVLGHPLLPPDVMLTLPGPARIPRSLRVLAHANFCGLRASSSKLSPRGPPLLTAFGLPSTPQPLRSAGTGCGVNLNCFLHFHLYASWTDCPRNKK